MTTPVRHSSRLAAKRSGRGAAGAPSMSFQDPPKLVSRSSARKASAKKAATSQAQPAAKTARGNTAAKKAAPRASASSSPPSAAQVELSSSSAAEELDGPPAEQQQQQQQQQQQNSAMDSGGEQSSEEPVNGGEEFASGGNDEQMSGSREEYSSGEVPGAEASVDDSRNYPRAAVEVVALAQSRRRKPVIKASTRARLGQAARESAAGAVSGRKRGRDLDGRGDGAARVRAIRSEARRESPANDSASEESSDDDLASSSSSEESGIMDGSASDSEGSLESSDSDSDSGEEGHGLLEAFKRSVAGWFTFRAGDAGGGLRGQSRTARATKRERSRERVRKMRSRRRMDDRRRPLAADAGWSAPARSDTPAANYDESHEGAAPAAKRRKVESLADFIEKEVDDITPSEYHRVSSLLHDRLRSGPVDPLDAVSSGSDGGAAPGEILQAFLGRSVPPQEGASMAAASPKRTRELDVGDLEASAIPAAYQPPHVTIPTKRYRPSVSGSYAGPALSLVQQEQLNRESVPLDSAPNETARRILAALDSIPSPLAAATAAVQASNTSLSSTGRFGTAGLSSSFMAERSLNRSLAATNRSVGSTHPERATGVHGTPSFWSRRTAVKNRLGSLPVTSATAATRSDRTTRVRNVIMLGVSSSDSDDGEEVSSGSSDEEEPAEVVKGTQSEQKDSASKTIPPPAAAQLISSVARKGVLPLNSSMMVDKIPKTAPAATPSRAAESKLKFSPIQSESDATSPQLGAGSKEASVQKSNTSSSAGSSAPLAKPLAGPLTSDLAPKKPLIPLSFGAAPVSAKEDLASAQIVDLKKKAETSQVVDLAESSSDSEDVPPIKPIAVQFRKGAALPAFRFPSADEKKDVPVEHEDLGDDDEEDKANTSPPKVDPAPAKPKIPEGPKVKPFTFGATPSAAPEITFNKPLPSFNGKPVEFAKPGSATPENSTKPAEKEEQEQARPPMTGSLFSFAANNASAPTASAAAQPTIFKFGTQTNTAATASTEEKNAVTPAPTTGAALPIFKFGAKPAPAASTTAGDDSTTAPPADVTAPAAAPAKPPSFVFGASNPASNLASVATPKAAQPFVFGANTGAAPTTTQTHTTNPLPTVDHASGNMGMGMDASSNVGTPAAAPPVFKFGQGVGAPAAPLSAAPPTFAFGQQASGSAIPSTPAAAPPTFAFGQQNSGAPAPVSTNLSAAPPTFAFGQAQPNQPAAGQGLQPNQGAGPGAGLQLGGQQPGFQFGQSAAQPTPVGQLGGNAGGMGGGLNQQPAAFPQASAPPVFGAGLQQQAANGGLGGPMPGGFPQQANGGGLGGAFALGAGPPRRKVTARRSRR